MVGRHVPAQNLAWEIRETRFERPYDGIEYPISRERRDENNADSRRRARTANRDGSRSRPAFAFIRAEKWKLVFGTDTQRIEIDR